MVVVVVVVCGGVMVVLWLLTDASRPAEEGAKALVEVVTSEPTTAIVEHKVAIFIVNDDDVE